MHHRRAPNGTANTHTNGTSLGYRYSYIAKANFTLDLSFISGSHSLSKFEVSPFGALFTRFTNLKMYYLIFSSFTWSFSWSTAYLGIANLIACLHIPKIGSSTLFQQSTVNDTLVIWYPHLIFSARLIAHSSYLLIGQIGISLVDMG